MKKCVLFALLCLVACGKEKEVTPDPVGLHYKGQVYPVFGELFDEAVLPNHYLWSAEFTDAGMQENRTTYFEGNLVLGINLFAAGNESFNPGEYVYSADEPVGLSVIRGSLFEDSNKNGKVEKQFDDQHVITGGNILIEKDAETDVYHFIFQLTLENGETLSGEYKKALARVGN